MDTPAQDYLAARAEMRPLLEDEWAELESIAAAMDAALYGLERSQQSAPTAFFRVLALGQFSQEIRLRLLAKKMEGS